MDTITFAAAVNNINDTHTIVANTLRTELILYAGKNNTADVWLSSEQDEGIPLIAGDRITLNSNQAVTLNGAENDRVLVAEIAKQVSQ